MVIFMLNYRGGGKIASLSLMILNWFWKCQNASEKLVLPPANKSVFLLTSCHLECSTYWMCIAHGHLVCVCSCALLCICSSINLNLQMFSQCKIYVMAVSYVLRTKQNIWHVGTDLCISVNPAAEVISNN